MAKSKNTRKLALVISLSVIALLATLTYSSRNSKDSAKTEPTRTSNSPVNTVTPNSGSNTPSLVPAATSTPPSSARAKPTLQKSSGNAPGSSIPAGALVEFTCTTTASESCFILLEDKAGGKTIQLDSKKMVDNGRGQFAAIWSWKSASGSWTVVAQTNLKSDPQTLEVK